MCNLDYSKIKFHYKSIAYRNFNTLDILLNAFMVFKMLKSLNKFWKPFKNIKYNLLFLSLTHKTIMRKFVLQNTTKQTLTQASPHVPTELRRFTRPLMLLLKRRRLHQNPKWAKPFSVLLASRTLYTKPAAVNRPHRSPAAVARRPLRTDSTAEPLKKIEIGRWKPEQEREQVVACLVFLIHR